MFRRIFAPSVLVALALAGCLLAPSAVLAQQGQRLYNWSGGWGGARDSYGFYNDAGYGGAYSSVTPSETYAPNYAYVPTTTYTPSYAYAAPTYYIMPTVAASGAPSGYQSFYPPEPGNDSSNVPAANGKRGGLIKVAVPADAQIWFDGNKTVQAGTLRHYITPPLGTGQAFAYTLKARWLNNGQEVTQTREVTVRAGETASVSFPTSTGQ
jgi:uncharacterized protein (TIGR03000 family)